VYRILSDGTVEDWIVDSLLVGVPNTPFPVPIGANGIAFSGSDLFVNNLTAGSIVRIPVQPDGSAGTPTVAFSDPLLFGADGLAADGQGNLYVANIARNTILRVSPEGTIDVLADIDDGLDGPSSLELGMNQDIFFVNSALVTADLGGTPMPSLMRVVIPEPSTLVLTVCGLACLLGCASRRMKDSHL
jgi:sugar lactone lactonase YvrE